MHRPTWGAAEVFSKWRHARAVSAVTALLLVSTLSVLSYHETSYWEINEKLWRHAIQDTPGNFVAQNSLATAPLEKGELGQAAQHYQEALKLEHGAAVVHDNLGKVFERERRLDGAMFEF